jgi:hypothetical protein
MDRTENFINNMAIRAFCDFLHKVESADLLQLRAIALPPCAKVILFSYNSPLKTVFYGLGVKKCSLTAVFFSCWAANTV